nr:hypothetical protein [Tanacetum cinerariifolium]
MWETNSYKTHKDHMMLYEALEKSMNRDNSKDLLKYLAEARKKKKKRRDSPKTPLGLHLISHLLLYHHQIHLEHQDNLALLDHHKYRHHLLHLYPPTQKVSHMDLLHQALPRQLHLQMDDDMAPDAQVHSSDDEDIRNAYIPKVNLWQDWWKPLKEDRIATPEPTWSILASDVPVPKNNWASALACTYSPPPEDSVLAQTGPAFELVKVFHPNVIHIQYQMEECHKLLIDRVDDSIIRHNVSKPLPLGGPPSQVTIQSDFFFNKDLEYLRYGRKGSIPALSILKIKVAYYLDVGLEKMVPDQMWIDEECKYDIAAIHASEGDRRAVRTHMRILSVVRIEVFSMYGYDYIKKIFLRRANLNEQIITERDFKYLYPSDFEDLYLLNLQGHLNHLPPKDKTILTTAVNLWTRQLVTRQRVENFQLGIESYQTQLNLTKPRWDATCFEYKHDYTIDKALDYWVKEFKVNRMNSGLNTRFWTRKDVDRSKEFMFAI